MTTPPLLYRQRDRLSGVVTLALAVAGGLFAIWAPKLRQPPPPPPEKPMTIRLAPMPETAPAPAPAPQPPQPKPPVTPPPQHTPPPPPRPVTPPPVARPTPAPQPAPRPVAPAPATPAPAAPVQSAPPAPAAPAVEHPAPAPVAHAPVTPPAPPAPPPAAPKSNSGDHSYEAQVLGLVESRKMYPTNRQAMLEHPQGTARVCVSISRGGSAQDARIANSSGSMVLDQAAKHLVTGLSYPPFPDQSFAGQDHHEFCMNVEYHVPDSD